MARALVVLVLTSVVAVSCSPPTPTPTGGGGGTSLTGGGGGGTATGGGGGSQGTNDCVWLINCATNCADTDQACRDACGAQSTSAAIGQYNALVDCANAHACADTACIETSCASQLTACRGSTGTGGGGGSSGGLTTSGRCEITVAVPNSAPIVYCWDYELTVTTNHNDGVEHFVYRDSQSAGSGQSTCTSENGQTFSAPFSGPWDDSAASMQNVTNKRNACTLAGSQPYTTATWAESAACSLSGSLGHCTRNVTNVWDGQNLNSTVQTAWTVP